MSETQRTVVDFVARSASNDEWLMVLVEEGPWASPIEARLRRIQDRLYGCVDAAIQGALAEQFPESTGKRVVIRLDCYEAPGTDLSDFFARFSEGIFRIEDYRRALADSPHVREIAFELNLEAFLSD